MEIVLVMGYPAAGKSSHVESLVAKGHVRLNRDERGGTLADLLKPLADEIQGARRDVVLDNTYATIESRKPLLELAQKHGVPVRGVLLGTSIEDAQVNAVARMIARHGKLLTPEEIKAVGKKDPNVFPPTVLFRYRKVFEKPTTAEGFASVETVPFVRRPAGGEYVNKAVILDYDGTLRTTKSGEKYPRSPDDIELLPGRKPVLERYLREGYTLVGVSNQGDVARGKLTASEAAACFERTNALLGLAIDYAFCPHDPAPINCFCRKPMPGLGVHFIEKYKLDRAHTLMVGDMTTDKTFAERVGIRFVDQAEFFK